LEDINDRTDDFKFSHWDENGIAYFKHKDGWFLPIMPKFEISDILWVRETFADIEIWDEIGQKYEYQYKAEDNDVLARWKPSIHMPKAAARIFLEVTDVRIERLQDISNEDAVAEGVIVIEPDETYYAYDGNIGTYAT